MCARRLVVALGLAALAALAACEQPAKVVILDARPFRGADGRVIVDVEIEGVEQGGGATGPYCVSVHWFDIGVDPALLDVQLRYPGETDFVSLCANDLGDGDRRTVRLVSNKTDLRVGAPARVQARLGRAFETRGVGAP